ncbi:ABC transporter permease subunit [Undibacterium sp. RuTC16W]|uniref:ABC transporter permease subunit n=1 Tax=Undibacterium sp. RuTC16W TaxID=3413048 RepID=UPI003BF36F18
MKKITNLLFFWRSKQYLIAPTLASDSVGPEKFDWGRWLSRPSGARLIIGVPFVWLIVIFLLPFLMVIKISLLDTDLNGPFGSLFSYIDGMLHVKLKIGNYLFILQDSLYVMTYLQSIKYAAITTFICLVIGYPFTYFMARARESIRPTLLMLVMLPFWTSFLLRIFAWKGIMANDGLLNNFLLSIGVIDSPLHMMNTAISLMVGMTYAYLPFMILPLYANLVKMDVRYLEAAADLGAKPWYTFFYITIPLSKSGIVAGSMLVFIPCIGEYVIPELLGGPETLMIGHVLWDEFFTNNDWSLACAVTVFLVLLILLPMSIFSKYKSLQTEGPV